MNIVLRHSLASEMQTCRHLYADGDLSEHVIKLLLHDAEIAELARRFGWERYPAGKVVFLQGDYGSDFRVIRQGEARVTVATAAGNGQCIPTEASRSWNGLGSTWRCPGRLARTQMHR